MRPPTDVWPTLDILERLAVQRRVTNNHLKKKEVTCTSSGFWPSPVLEPPISYLAASLIRKYGSPRVSSAPDSLCRRGSLVLSETFFYLWDGYGSYPSLFRCNVASPGIRPAVRVYLLSAPTQSCTPLGVSPPGPHTCWAVSQTWAGSWHGLLLGSRVISRLPKTNPCFPQPGERSWFLALGTVQTS